jgi:hypothetical protein
MAIARAVGGEAGSDELIQAGVDALLAGVDSPTLPLLAGLTRREEPEAPSLFDRVADELGLVPAELPTDPASRAWALVRWWAQMIVDGELTPEMGGRLIWRHGWLLLDGPDELKPLIGSVTRHDDEKSSWAIWDAEYISCNRAGAADIVAQAHAFLCSKRVTEA